MQHNDPHAPNTDKAGEGEPEENAESYAGYAQGAELGFDPTVDLNLPGSYEEVLSRFKRLQGDRAWEVLN